MIEPEDSSNDSVKTLDIEKMDNSLEESSYQSKFKKAKLSDEEKQKLKLDKLKAKKDLEEEQLRIRKEKALKGMKYLLNLSEKYSDFFKDKVYTNTTNKATGSKRKNHLQVTAADMIEASSSERADIIDENTNTTDNLFNKIKYFTGDLRPYQLEGVKWLSVLYDNGLNGILADEMGLGKTVQVIALICHLMERKVTGPFLIVAPLSTIPNWKSEFERFAPKLPVFILQGSVEDRESAKQAINQKYTVDNIQTRPIVLTTYQMPLMEASFFQRYTWQFIVVDEGQRMKNHKSQLACRLRTLTSNNRLLLTGTPLQNNITELWALLNFLLPQIFNNLDTFASLLMIEDVQNENKLIEQEESHGIVSTIHKVLAPFMLRRLKSEVLTDMVPKKEVTIYCPMTKFQKELYTNIIDKNMAKLRGEEEEANLQDITNGSRRKRKCTEKVKLKFYESDSDDYSDFEEELLSREEKENIVFEKQKKDFVVRLTMTNTMVMFKKVVDHPYLVHMPLDPNSKKKAILVDKNLINVSGKMIVLDAMLKKLKAQGHKVLIFSTLVMLLDLVEEYLIMTNQNYQRLDGSKNLESRAECIHEFNNNPESFIFLISTRAGGLGLNLTAADTVIFFDRDWNPQADIQAQDRCHRIGQTKPVVVYSLITKNTIDETIVDCGNLKRRLEKIVIRDGKFTRLGKTERNKTENELLELKKLLESEEKSSDAVTFCQEELDRLLDRSDLYALMKK